MDKIFAAAQRNPKSDTDPAVTSSGARNEQALDSGVVLGKDGKPCRTCTDSAAWRALMSGSKKTSNSSASTTATATTAGLVSSQIPTTSTSDCPPDVAELGRSTWTLLHSLAATYPSSAPPEKQQEMSQFLNLFSKLYPCWVCAEDFQVWMAREKPILNGRSGFGDWMCRAHNEVNRKLGKKEFDCKRWEERWRDGWKDGSCD